LGLSENVVELRKRRGYYQPVAKRETERAGCYREKEGGKP